MSITLTAEQYRAMVAEIQGGQTDIVTIGIRIGLSVEDSNGEAFRQFVDDAIVAFRKASSADLFRACVGREPASQEELDGAMGRVGPFVAALEAGDPEAMGVVQDFVDAFKMDEPLMAPFAPKAERRPPRTVVPPLTTALHTPFLHPRPRHPTPDELLSAVTSPSTAVLAHSSPSKAKP